MVVGAPGNPIGKTEALVDPVCREIRVKPVERADGISQLAIHRAHPEAPPLVARTVVEALTLAIPTRRHRHRPFLPGLIRNREPPSVGDQASAQIAQDEAAGNVRKRLALKLTAVELAA